MEPDHISKGTDGKTGWGGLHQRLDSNMGYKRLFHVYDHREEWKQCFDNDAEVM